MGGRPSPRKIIGFTVIDDGEGFTDENMNAFKTLDTRHKIDMGGRGIGRLMWLKAFEKVSVESVYEENGLLRKKKFLFDVENGIHNCVDEDAEGQPIKTTVELLGFKEKYRMAAHKQGDIIARDILEHCMWYFLREGGVSNITVVDAENEYNLLDIYDECIGSNTYNEVFEIDSIQFSMIHVKNRNDLSLDSPVVLCANNRAVKSYKCSNKSSWVNRKISDQNGDFVYRCFITSEYLDSCVRPDRMDFEFEGDMGDLFETNNLTKEKLFCEIERKIAGFLSSEMQTLKEQSQKKIRHYVEYVSPRYRAILPRLNDFIVDPGISDCDLELELHKRYAKTEEEIIKESGTIYDEIQSLNDTMALQKMQEFMEKVNAVKSSELTAYVFYRNYVLKMLRLIIRKQKEGGYIKEEVIHNLIFPMRNTSDSMSFRTSNLWIIDEKMAFHTFLASDKTLKSMPVFDTTSSLEPDLLICKNWGLNDSNEKEGLSDNPLLVGDAGDFARPRSLCVVEFKRPMRDDYKDEKDPLDQVLDYFEKIKEGKIIDCTGRPINADNVPLFGYIVADITPKLARSCRKAELKQKPDGAGFFGYKSDYNAYIEVITFDDLLQSAYERNKAFFDKLGLCNSI